MKKRKYTKKAATELVSELMAIDSRIRRIIEREFFRATQKKENVHAKFDERELFEIATDLVSVYSRFETDKEALKRRVWQLEGFLK